MKYAVYFDALYECQNEKEAEELLMADLIETVRTQDIKLFEMVELDIDDKYAFGE
jgi:hypothetical protein